jgi:hypothetical protein
MTVTTSPLFTPVTVAAAPEASKPFLEGIRRSLGFIPNMMATFANNPIVLEGYLALEDVFERGSFTPKERQINKPLLWRDRRFSTPLTISRELSPRLHGEASRVG